jgi:hypothetical protein
MKNVNPIQIQKRFLVRTKLSLMTALSFSSFLIDRADLTLVKKEREKERERERERKRGREREREREGERERERERQRETER